MLGLVRRDLLIDIADAVAREDAAGRLRAGRPGGRVRLRAAARHPRAGAADARPAGRRASIASRVERSGDCRRRRARARCCALAAQFSAEDLMRAFDVLTKAELEIRGSMQPRYHLEMALLRWIHLRKLVPLTDLIQGLESGGARRRHALAPQVRPPPPRARGAAAPRRRAAASAAMRRRSRPSRRAASRRSAGAPAPSGRRRPVGGRASQPHACAGRRPGSLKDAFLEEMRKAKKFFYGTVDRAGAADRRRGGRDRRSRSRRSTRAARAARSSRGRRSKTIATQLAGRRMAVVAAEGAAAISRRRSPAAAGARGRHRIASPSCGSRRSPTRACRRCSTCSPPRSRTSKSDRASAA